MAILFSFFLIYDTQQLIGGKKYAISPEEHIFAAIQVHSHAHAHTRTLTHTTHTHTTHTHTTHTCTHMQTHLHTFTHTYMHTHILTHYAGRSVRKHSTDTLFWPIMSIHSITARGLKVYRSAGETVRPVALMHCQCMSSVCISLFVVALTQVPREAQNMTGSLVITILNVNSLKF